VGVVIAWQHHLYWTVPYLILYAASFAYVGGLSLWHARRARSEFAGFKLQTSVLAGNAKVID
jgi:predicted small integral membrane protein